MTDRELLEMAAKSIGLTLRYNYLGGRDANQPWNPLEDDGDALRLAVKLNMKLEKVVSCLGSAWVADGRCMESVGSDQMASVRRAIVRAAASIGEQT